MYRIIGLMSGTSLDGVDAALIETDGETEIRPIAGFELAYAPRERAALQAAVDAALLWQFGGADPEAFEQAEHVLTDAHAHAVQRLLTKADLHSDDIDLIGFHGQTVLHRAPANGKPGATRQLGDGEALAKRLGIDVVYDFRSADVEAGGQGAPLAPLYHAALAARDGLETPLVVLNLGGVANVTWLGGDDPVAFDTGPASGLIDAWCQRVAGIPYDTDGLLAGRGKVDAAALKELMSHSFFALEPPKSLDRWDFSLDAVADLAPEDGAATLTEFTARTVAGAITAMGEPLRVLVTGGGRKNPAMMARIAALLDCPVEPVEAAGWNGDLMEAEAFAWLAARSVRAVPLSLPTTTGVPEPMTGGELARA
ncbi:anhydro-N-acetylmuramic acid kinase [Hyphobacterium marinum]|uniref:Anhydro-N-acetylmuramic acid kinase n=1 Tax=Hyphobacterium marinum TaxID=3116574 RepID=A0ABU7M0B9_9PROT|nr:anhydro-N-acetylmuramic acid kinase [Hyphobacterium sp. Y6023]MEE2567266.1 anhydro-N-acetylmuramic acid kinase [Hyphobacterium sp. Y6023]